MIQYRYIAGQTPLDEIEKRDLIPSLITREDLDAWEQENILEARKWLMRKATLSRNDLLSDGFLMELHKRMLGRVWKWAGSYRRTEKNIGVPYYEIPTQLHQLLGDARYWQEHQTFPTQTMALMLHHRLVKIHLFANGNGRHARLCADAIVAKHGAEAFTWSGNSDLTKPDELRRRYIAALHEADQGNYEPLIAFATT